MCVCVCEYKFVTTWGGIVFTKLSLHVYVATESSLRSGGFIVTTPFAMVRSGHSMSSCAMCVHNNIIHAGIISQNKDTHLIFVLLLPQ